MLYLRILSSVSGPLPTTPYLLKRDWEWLWCLALYRYYSVSPCGSVQFSHSVMSDSLWPHGLQHARPPCPSLTPRAWSNSCPWVSDAIQPSHPLSSPSPAFNLSSIRVFSNEWLFSSGGQNIGASASASVLPMDIQGWFPLGLTGLISLLSKGLSRVFSSTAVQKQWLFGTQPSSWSNSRIHTWLLEKP